MPLSNETPVAFSVTKPPRARRFHIATLATHAALFWVLTAFALCQPVPLTPHVVSTQDLA